MAAVPQVSVVMAAFNDAERLPETIECILAQEGVDFEFIIINDGSTDQTPDILEKYSQSDPRIRVITQENEGLTRALIRGCRAARGEFIARQDVGDISLPGRLAAQLAAFDNRTNIAFVSCCYDLIGPCHEILAEPRPPDQGRSIIESLSQQHATKLAGPHHGTVMFRKKAYETVGGYRSQFYFAQDIDLWARMVEVGSLEFVKETLYQVVFEPTSITGRWRNKQVLIYNYITEATNLRRKGESEEEVLAAAARVRPEHRRKDTKQISNGLYFIGGCLESRGDPRANKYLRQSIQANPANLRAWAKFTRSNFRRLFRSALS